MVVAMKCFPYSLFCTWTVNEGHNSNRHCDAGFGIINGWGDAALVIFFFLITGLNPETFIKNKNYVKQNQY